MKKGDKVMVKLNKNSIDSRLNVKRLARALRHTANAGDLLELPAWVVGSKEDPSFLYGVFICSREIVVEILKLDSDLEITGMLKTTRDESETLN